MDTATANRALVDGHTRGFVTIEETPTDPPTPEVKRLLENFNDHCARLKRHRVLVCRSAFGLWRTMIAFEDRPDNELAYVRDAITRAFVDYFGCEPRRDDPEAWYGSTDDRWLAEALAAALVAIDSQRRDPAFDVVYTVHTL